MVGAPPEQKFVGVGGVGKKEQLSDLGSEEGGKNCYHFMFGTRSALRAGPGG
jgi:hypothetical protein